MPLPDGLSQLSHRAHKTGSRRKEDRKPVVTAGTAALAVQRALAEPTSLTPVDVLTLQRTIGNQATIDILQPILQKRSMVLGPDDDAYEQEANQTATKVVRRIDAPSVRPHAASQAQREIVPEDEQRIDAQTIQPQAPNLFDSAHRYDRSPPIRRTFTVQRGEATTATHGPEGGAVDETVQEHIEEAQGQGHSLDYGVRRQMEDGFNADFNAVRIHTDQRADVLNRSLNARAFTVGNDVFFRGGAYKPGTRDGKHLLAHELTHTVQQGAAVRRRGADTIQRFIYKGDNPYEVSQRMNPVVVRKLLEATYNIPEDITNDLINDYGHPTKNPIRLGELVKKAHLKKLALIKNQNDIQNQNNLDNQDELENLNELENQNEPQTQNEPPINNVILENELEETEENEINNDEQEVLDEPQNESDSSLLPSREAVIEALKTGTPLSASSENAANLYKITINNKDYVVKYEKKFGGLRESLPPTIAKKYGLGDYYVDAVSYPAPDNQREMVVMPFVKAKTGKNLTVYQERPMDPKKQQELVLFEWLIGSTDRHSENVMFNEEDQQPWKLFDHGGSLGVGARGGKVSSAPHMRLGPLNMIFEAYIESQVPMLRPSQIKSSYGMKGGRGKIPPEYESLKISKETVEKILAMGNDVLLELAKANAPEEYTAYVQVAINHLNTLLEKGGDSITFAGLLAPPKSKPQPKPKKAKKAKQKKKPKKLKKPTKDEPKQSSQTGNLSDKQGGGPPQKLDDEVYDPKVDELFGKLKDAYIKHNQIYPFTSIQEARAVKKQLSLRVKELGNVELSKLMPEFERWVVESSDLGDNETPVPEVDKNTYKKVEVAYEKLYGLKLSPKEDIAMILLAEVMIEGGRQEIEADLNPNNQEYAQELAFYLSERFRVLNVNFEDQPNQEKNEKKKIVRKPKSTMNDKKAQHLLKTQVNKIAGKLNEFKEWLKQQNIEFSDLNNQELVKQGKAYQEIVVELEIKTAEEKQRRKLEELQQRKERAEKIQPEAFAKKIAQAIDNKEQGYLAEMAEVLAMWPQETRKKFMEKLPKQYHGMALAAGFGPLGETGLEYGKAVQFHKGQPKDAGGNFDRPMYKWLFANGPEPNTMNCWEAVLFAGYRIGMLSKEQARILDVPDDETSTPEIVRRVQKNKRGSIASDSQPAFIKLYNQNRPDIPLGDIVEWGGGRAGGSHVAVSLGGGMVIEHDATTGTGEAGVRISSLHAVTENVVPKCPSPVRMHWAPYSALLDDSGGQPQLEPVNVQESVDEEPESSTFKIVNPPTLADPAKQGENVFQKTDEYFQVQEVKTRKAFVIKSGQENIEIPRFVSLGENPPAWNKSKIKVENTEETDPKSQLPIYEVNDGHHRFVYQSTLGDGTMNLDVRESGASKTADGWPTMVWLVESWGKKGMDAQETMKRIREKEEKLKEQQKRFGKKN